MPAQLLRSCLPIAGLSALLLTGCGFDPGFIHGHLSETIKGSGVAKTEVRPLADFTQIDVGGASTMELTVGPATTFEITADDNILPTIKTEVADGKLKITNEKSTSSNIGVMIKASTPKLKGFRGGGAITAKVSGVKAADFRLELSGASNCTIAGSADQLNVDCSGASKVNAGDLVAKSVKADASGASHVTVHAAETLSADASGASSIRYTGNPTNIKKSNSGASSVGPSK